MAAPPVIIAQQQPVMLTIEGHPVLPPAPLAPVPLAADGSMDAAHAALWAQLYGGGALAGSGGSAGSGGFFSGMSSLQEQQLLGGGSASLPADGGMHAASQAAAPPPQAKAPKARKPRPYKPPDQVQAEKRRTAEVKVRRGLGGQQLALRRRLPLRGRQ